MPRSKNGRVQPDRNALHVEIAHLRELDVGALRARWHTMFGRRPPPHLPRRLLFRILAYRLQADHLGDLDPESQRLLDRSETPEKAVVRRSAGFDADQARRQLLEECQHLSTLQLPPQDDIAFHINTVSLKHRLRDIETDCRDR